MTSILTKIITNVLQALYSPFVFATLFSFFAMFFYLFCKHPNEGGVNWKQAIFVWLKYFKKERLFRKLTLLCFYGTMVLFRTLLNRNFGLNPLSEVMAGWWIYKTDLNTGETILTTECIENLILFIPFTAILYWCCFEKIFPHSKKFRTIVWVSLKISLGLSLLIEFIQLFLRVGSFQFSDIFYNTLGGVIGGSLYWVLYKVEQWNKNC